MCSSHPTGHPLFRRGLRFRSENSGKPGSFLRASYDRPAADEKRALAISTANSKSRHCGEHQNPGGIVRELASARSLTEELVEAGADVRIDLDIGSLGSWSHKRYRKLRGYSRPS